MDTIKTSLNSLLLACCMLASTHLAACTTPQDGNDPQDNGTTDSIVFNQEKSHTLCHIHVEPPREPLREAVGEWLDEQLGGRYKGDAANLQTLVKFYGKAWADTLHQAWKDNNPYGTVEFDARMEKAYENDHVVTYTLSTFLGLGGAHPTSGETGATFRKRDGKRLTWDIVRHDLSYLFNDLKRDLLKGYFQCESDEALGNILPDPFDIPNPQTPPFFTQEGIVLIYQQYEIAGYAMGMPGGTIPYGKLEPLMTEQAKKLLP